MTTYTVTYVKSLTDHETRTAQVTVSENGSNTGFYATALGLWGCGKNSSTPEGAIHMLVQDMAAIVSIERVLTPTEQLEYATAVSKRAHEQLEAAQVAAKAADRALADLCPHQPGALARVADFAGIPLDMWVERVSADAERGVWTLNGKKMTKSGKPHTTATAYAFVHFA